MKETRTIFLSHANKDKEAAEAIGDWLKQVFTGIEVFISSIELGEDFNAQIMEALRSCRLGIILVTPNSSERIWINFEVGALLALDKPVIPLLAGGLGKNQLPATFNTRQACEYDDEDERLQMVDLIARMLATQPVSRKTNKAPAIKIAPSIIDTTRYFDRRKREETENTISHIIQSATDAGSELWVQAIANTDFFLTPTFNKELRTALEKGLRAKFIFLDPKSANAFRREIYESNRLDTRAVISSCIKAATDFRNKFGNSVLQIRLAQEVSCFLCFNDTDMVMHTYFISETGHQTPTGVVTSSSAAYNIGKEHFEKLWGERWVLFDLGNVLIPFNHNRVSKGLEPHLSKQLQGSATRRSIHNFFFGTEGDESRNTRLDRGATSLATVHRDFCKKFKSKIGYAKFEAIWCSIFETPDQTAMSCMTRIKKLGMRIGICSNTNQAHWNYLRKCYPKLVKNAHMCFLSFDDKIKKVKSDPAFFEKVAKMTECPVEDHLLIDDLSANLETAKAAGMHVMQAQRSLTYEDVEDVLKELHWV